MTVAELAKRFENARLVDVVHHHPPPPKGKVHELARRIEQAVGESGTPRSTFGASTGDDSGRGTAGARTSGELDVSAGAVMPSESFPSPPQLPNVNPVLSRNHVRASPTVQHPSPQSATTPETTSVPPSIERLPIAQAATPGMETPSPSRPPETPEQLTLQQRLARYEQLTSPRSPPSYSPSTATNTPPSRHQSAPRTPSTQFSTASSASPNRVEIIPDVSEGDLDDIEGMERVDEERVEDTFSATDTFDGDTFRRAETIVTLPSRPGSSSHTPEEITPPSHPSTPSNASENSSFSSAEFASATGEFQTDRPAPHTLAAPLSAPRQASNLSAQPHTLHIAPGSFKKLPKAKVMIARRREQEDAGEARMSHDDTSRRLIREYHNPRELLEGNVSLVELSDDESVEFRDPEISDVRRDTSIRRKHRADAFRHRFDEFMDPQEIEHANEVVEEDVSSKEKYSRRRLFRRGKVEKARQREERVARQREAVARRSTVISGALDRVSLAADPWIDFITDANTLPGVKTGGLRRGLKRLFGFGRHNAGLIKSRE